jgi:hypothetical protein
MSLPRHTPGPWEVEFTNHGAPVVVGPLDNYQTIAVVDGVGAADGRIFSKEEVRANADLIAAAPDLSIALELVIDAWGVDDDRWIKGDMDAAIREGRAALAKARGEAS